MSMASVTKRLKVNVSNSVRVIAKDGKVLLYQGQAVIEIDPADIPKITSEVIAAAAAAGMGMEFPVANITFN